MFEVGNKDRQALPPHAIAKHGVQCPAERNSLPK